MSDPLHAPVRPNVPTRADVDSLMKRCQIGVGGRRALDDAHSIMADCYGTLGALMMQVEILRYWRDCRTCRNYTTASGGCRSTLRCVDGGEYRRLNVVQHWETTAADAGF